MKKQNDPRHLSRIKIMQTLFSLSFQQKQKISKGEHTSSIIANLPRIDRIIGQSAPAFPIVKIAKVDLAILRLAVFELLVAKKNPPKVIIDEAVELAKEFGGDTSSSFVNGVLGDILKKGEKNGSKNN